MAKSSLEISQQLISNSSLTKLISHPNLRIDNSLQQTALYFHGATKFVNSLICTNRRFHVTPICPFQFDLCIAVGKPFQILDNDNDLNEDDELQNGQIFGDGSKSNENIEDKLIANKLRYESAELDASLTNFDLRTREFRDLLKALKEKYAYKEPFDIEGKYVYPHQQRFVIMIDQRNIDNTSNKHAKMYIYEPPQHCRNIPHQGAREWCINATKECLLPGGDRDGDIGAASARDGSLLTLSFHVLQSDDIQCYLGWNGQLTHCKIDEIMCVLPKIFTMEHTWYGMRNLRFMKRNMNDDEWDGINDRELTLNEMTQEMNEIISRRDDGDINDCECDHDVDNDQHYDGDSEFELEPQYYPDSNIHGMDEDNPNKLRSSYGSCMISACYPLEVACNEESKDEAEERMQQGLGSYHPGHNEDKYGTIVILPSSKLRFTFMVTKYEPKFDPEWVNEYEYDRVILYKLHSPYRVLNALILLQAPSLIKPFNWSELEYVGWDEELDEDVLNEIENIVANKFNDIKPTCHDLDFLHGHSFPNQLPDLNPNQSVNNTIISCPLGSNPSNSSFFPYTNNGHNNNNNNSDKRNGNSSRDNNSNDGRESGNGGDGDGDDEKNNRNNGNRGKQNQQNLSYQDLLQIISVLTKQLDQNTKQITQQTICINALRQSNEVLLKQISLNQNMPINQHLLSLSINTMQDINKLKQKNKRLQAMVNQQQSLSLKRNITSTPTVPTPIPISIPMTTMQQSQWNSPITPNMNKNPYRLQRQSFSSLFTSPIQGTNATAPGNNTTITTRTAPPSSAVTTLRLPSITYDSSSSSMNCGRPKQKQHYSLDTKKKKTKPSTKPQNGKTKEFSYTAPKPQRLKTSIYVPRKLTQSAVSKIDTKFKNNKELYSWMNGNAPLQFNRNENQINGSTKIFNFGFIDKENKEELFCIVDKADEEKKDNNPKKAGIYAWEMRERLYTKKGVSSNFTNNTKDLPKPIQADITPLDPINFKILISKTKWCKIPVFSKLDKKKRISLMIIPEGFKNTLETRNNLDEPPLIPIVMYNKDCAQVHYVMIAEIDDGINVGISIIYDDKRKQGRITGIHIDKESLQRQHRWVSLQHAQNCHCFDNFTSNIDNLLIGNMKDNENTLNNLRWKNDDLHRENQRLSNELKSYRDRSTSPSTSLSSILSLTSPALSRSSSDDFVNGSFEYASDSEP